MLDKIKNDWNNINQKQKNVSVLILLTSIIGLLYFFYKMVSSILFLSEKLSIQDAFTYASFVFLLLALVTLYILFQNKKTKDKQEV